MIPSVYLNLEDDVSKIVARLKHINQPQAILVCPKRCLLLSDSINLRLLKKQTDLLGKEVFILTMDERGQAYAKEAGFSLKFFPKTRGSAAMSDVKRPQKQAALEQTAPALERQKQAGALSGAVDEIKHIAKKFIPAVVQSSKSAFEPNLWPAEADSKAQRLLVTDSVFPDDIQSSDRQLPEPAPRSGKLITGFVALSLIIILALVFVVLPKARVVVYARTEPVTRDMEITMGANINSIDPSKLIIPAVKVDETVNLGDAFQSQGKQQVGNKASGSIQIYNFTRLPINLKAATTVLTVGSKTYVLAADVSGMRPTAYKNQKTKEVDPASLGDPVQIMASSGGEDYNLPAGTRMEITNQVFGSRPLVLYAKTVSEISGGTTRYLSVISQDDISKAQSALQDRALAQIRQKLGASQLLLPDTSYSFTVSQFTTDNPVGAQTPSFQASLQAKLSGLAFKQDDLKSVIFQRIKQTLDTNKTLLPKQDNSTGIKVKNYDAINQLAVLSVHFEGLAVFDVNLPDISGMLVGKSQSQANEILRSQAEIDKVEITLAPAWQKNFPLFARQIQVVVATTTPAN